MSFGWKVLPLTTCRNQLGSQHLTTGPGQSTCDQNFPVVLIAFPIVDLPDNDCMAAQNDFDSDCSESDMNFQGLE